MPDHRVGSVRWCRPLLIVGHHSDCVTVYTMPTRIHYVSLYRLPNARGQVLGKIRFGRWLPRFKTDYHNIYSSPGSRPRPPPHRPCGYRMASTSLVTVRSTRGPCGYCISLVTRYSRIRSPCRSRLPQ